MKHPKILRVFILLHFVHCACSSSCNSVLVSNAINATACTNVF